MNQLFSFKRWNKLLVKHWFENRKRYLLSLLALGGLIAGFYSFIILATKKPIQTNVQAMTYFFGLYLSGCLLGSTLFDDLNQPPRAIGFLLLPASQLEKLLTHIFYGVLIFFASYTLVFYLVDAAMVQIANNLRTGWNAKNTLAAGIYPETKMFNIFSGSDDMKPIPMPGNLNAYLLLTYFVAQAAYILGSVYFGKYSFIKTSISLLGLFFFLFLYYGIFLNHITPGNSFYDSLTSWRLNDAGTMKYIFLPQWTENLYYFLMKYAFAIFFLVIAYFRLKEKEI